MIFFLAFVFIGLLTYIFYLTYQIHKQQTEFYRNLKTLQSVIFQLNHEHEQQNNQLLVSDGLSKKIKDINNTLSKSIFEMNFQLFEDNYQKKK